LIYGIIVVSKDGTSPISIIYRKIGKEEMDPQILAGKVLASQIKLQLDTGLQRSYVHTDIASAYFATLPEDWLLIVVTDGHDEQIVNKVISNLLEVFQRKETVEAMKKFEETRNIDMLQDSILLDLHAAIFSVPCPHYDEKTHQCREYGTPRWPSCNAVTHTTCVYYARYKKESGFVVPILKNRKLLERVKDPNVLKVLKLCDGMNTLDDIAIKTGERQITIMRILKDYQRAGYIERRVFL